jgi:hypothetical protein
VLLCREKISPLVRYGLSYSKFKNRVHVFKGLGYETKDLERLALKKASAALILSDIEADDEVTEDANNSLRAWSFFEYAPHLPIYVETLLPETCPQLEEYTTGAFCIDDYQQGLLAYNCLYRGVATLLINLLKSSKENVIQNTPWVKQYADGMSNHIYSAIAPSAFVGVKFTELSAFLYDQFQVSLFAVEHNIPDYGDHVMLNPGPDYNIVEGDRCYYISQSYREIQQIAGMV